VLFIVFWKLVLTCSYVDEILVCDHNESYWTVHSYKTVNLAEQASSKILWPS